MASVRHPYVCQSILTILLQLAVTTVILSTEFQIDTIFHVSHKALSIWSNRFFLIFRIHNAITTTMYNMKNSIASTEETWGDDESSVLFFSLTQLGWILPTTSASISFVFSILVISFISRSQDLSNSYHRIMLFMSSWDVVSSLAIALTTVPMPSDVHDVYPFANGAFGSTSTCTIQGFAIVWGAIYTVWSNVALNIYYVCTIRFGMSNKTLNRRILPLMLGIGTIQVCIFSYIGSSLEIVNPRPFEPYCLVGSYPHDCIENESVECIRGDVSMSTVRSLRFAFMIIIGLCFFCIVTSLVLVVEAVFKTEIGWMQDYGRENASLTNTRTAMRQALMYIGAFFLTWVWLITTVSTSDEATSNIITALKIFFQPLQGFFNAAIFFSNKVSLLCKADPRLTRFAALRQTILSPSTVPRMLLSQIGEVDAGGENRNIIDMEQKSDERPSSELPSGVSIPSNITTQFDFALAVSASSSSNGRISSSSVDPGSAKNQRSDEESTSEVVANMAGDATNISANASLSSAANLPQVQEHQAPTRQIPTASRSRGEMSGDIDSDSGFNGSSIFGLSDGSSTSYDFVVQILRRGTLGTYRGDEGGN